jgi:tripartite-type tricarboxylate transporter receptor subunit TctC
LTDAVDGPHDGRMKIAALLACAWLGAASVACAQKFVVAAPGGSGADVVARAIAAKIGATVDNGAPEVVAKAAPDGNTLLFATPALTASIALQPKLPVDGLKAFAPVARVANEPLVLVATATFATSSVFDLIALAKANPGQISYASAGRGSATHVAFELLKSAGTITLSHVPAKSVDAAVADVVAGNAKVAFAPYGVAAPALRAGKLKALAVTGTARLPLLPDVPTMRESGLIDYDFNAWLGVLAPGATSKAAIDRVNDALRKAMQDPALRDKLAVFLGAEPRVSTPDEFAAQLRREVAAFEKLGRELGLKLE